MTNISILGAGSWGTALAILLAKKGISINLWVRNTSLLDILVNLRENTRYLPGIKIPNNVNFTDDLNNAITNTNIIVIVVPSHGIRDLTKRLIPILHPEKEYFLISASKGIELESLKLPLEIIREELELTHGIDRFHLSCLSGPNFAKEVALGLPTATVLASWDENEKTRYLQNILSTNSFRVYTSQDLTGVQLCGALKNVIAIAAGICDGLSLGTNARASLITRGLAEITRLGLALGAKIQTFSGLAGIGDLILTCTGDLSRNRQVGLMIGKGKKLQEIIKDMTMVAEGVNTSIAAYNLSKKLGIDMPITEEVYSILYNDKDPLKSLYDLINRPLKSEYFY